MISVIVSQALPWSWSVRWWRRCTRSRSRTFIKSSQLQRPPTPRCLRSKAAPSPSGRSRPSPPHLSNLSLLPFVSYTNILVALSFSVILSWFTFLGAVQKRSVNMRSHCTIALWFWRNSSIYLDEQRIDEVAAAVCRGNSLLHCFTWDKEMENPKEYEFIGCFKMSNLCCFVSFPVNIYLFSVCQSLCGPNELQMKFSNPVRCLLAFLHVFSGFLSSRQPGFKLNINNHLFCTCSISHRCIEIYLVIKHPNLVFPCCEKTCHWSHIYCLL